MFTYTRYLIIGLLFFAKLSFAGAVVDEIIDHNKRQISGSFEEYLSLLEDVDFGMGVDVVELDGIQSSTNNNRRSDNSTLTKDNQFFSDYIFLFNLHPKKQLKAKENSFFSTAIPSCREHFFAVHRMCPF